LRTSKETVERRNSMVNEPHKTRKWSKLKNGKCSTKSSKYTNSHIKPQSSNNHHPRHAITLFLIMLA
jgi:hypothetical protein